MYRFCYLPDKEKRLMAELMNFFVAMTKESHPCHVIIFHHREHRGHRGHREKKYRSVGR